MAFDAHSTPAPAGQVVPFPRMQIHLPSQGRLRLDDTLPANVTWLREPRRPSPEYTATSLLLGAIVSVMTPRQFTKLGTELQRRWEAGDATAMAAFDLAVSGAYYS